VRNKYIPKAFTEDEIKTMFAAVAQFN